MSVTAGMPVADPQGNVNRSFAGTNLWKSSDGNRPNLNASGRRWKGSENRSGWNSSAGRSSKEADGDIEHVQYAKQLFWEVRCSGVTELSCIRLPIW